MPSPDNSDRGLLRMLRTLQVNQLQKQMDASGHTKKNETGWLRPNRHKNKQRRRWECVKRFLDWSFFINQLLQCPVRLGSWPTVNRLTKKNWWWKIHQGVETPLWFIHWESLLPGLFVTRKFYCNVCSKYTKESNLRCIITRQFRLPGTFTPGELRLPSVFTMKKSALFVFPSHKIIV